MKTFMTLLLTFTTLFSGLASQIDFILNPQKYNAITLDTSRVPSPVEEPETDDFVQLSQVRMHYRVYGKGKPPLVLIHGNGGSVNSLKEAASYLANDFTVYLPESRCHGQSSDPGEISYELMAKDIKEFIDAMGLKKPVVMGHSDGGINAITLASMYPDV
ncbi:MAG: alpha/beta hydrolase, partial [Clostridia bacterium]|nr:alpha/beta hydrolase [Clostridia bacterium]